MKVTKGETLKKAILDAASKLFISKGLAGTSMKDIADELGVTRTAVYYYFRNKEAILRALTEEVTLSAKKQTEKVAARRDIDASQALRGLVEQHANLILSQPDEFRVVDRNEQDMPPRFRKESEAARRKIFENFSDVIRRGIEEGNFRRVDPKIAALAILGMCNWSAWWFKRDGRRSKEEISALITDLAVQALLSDRDRAMKNADVRERFRRLRDDVDDLAELLLRKPM